jgi:hypothetical protein
MAERLQTWAEVEKDGYIKELFKRLARSVATIPWTNNVSEFAH